MNKLIASSIVGAVLSLASVNASAALVTHIIEGKNLQDCGGNDKGVFGPSFPACNIGNILDPDVNISPAIVKFGWNEINDDGDRAFQLDATNFMSITGTEFSFVPNLTDNTFTWSYTRNDDADPVIRFYVQKLGSTQLRLTYESDTLSCSTTPLTLACLQSAKSITSGSGVLTGGQGLGLSHITFFDTEGVPVTRVPAPGALALLVLGLGGLAARKALK